jgi:hypothetical protein
MNFVYKTINKPHFVKCNICGVEFSGGICPNCLSSFKDGVNIKIRAKVKIK